MRPRLIALPAVLASALLATGCTAAPTNEAAEEFQGAEQEVAEVVDELSSAAVDGDADLVCDTLFSEELRNALGPSGTSCVDTVEDQLSDVSDPEIEVSDITVEGDEATATVVTPYGGEDVEQTLTFVRAGNAWRITGVEPPGPQPTAPAS